MAALRVVFIPDDLSPKARDVWPQRESTPNQLAVARFVAAVAEDPAVGVEVLGSLRSMSVGRGDPLLAYVGGLLAVMGFSFGISSFDSLDVMIGNVVTVAGLVAALIVAWLLFKAADIATDLEERARLATSWLGAFEDGLALAPQARRAQTRALRKSLARLDR